MKPQPPLHLLASFMAVVEHGSMTAAAHSLGFVPSAISQHVSSLEKSLSVELLVRRPGSRVTLTPAGRALANATTSLFAAAADFRDLADRIARSEITELRIGAYGSAMSHLLPGALADLRDQQNAPALQLTELETLDGLPLVRSGEIDLLVAHRYLPEDPPAASGGLILTPLGEEPMLLLARKGLDDVAFENFSDLDWVAGTPQDADRRLLRRWASVFDIEPRVRYETADCHTALSLISAGLAVGLIPATVGLSAEATQRTQIIPLPEGARAPTREVLAVTRTRYWPPIIDDLIRRLAAFLEQHSRR